MDFNTLAKQKLIENILSIKVWIIFAILGISTWLVLVGIITGTLWVTANSGTITAIVGLREAFKVTKIKTDNKTTMV